MELHASEASEASGCTRVSDFAAYLSWDFGLITTHGITTSVLLSNVSMLNSKWSGLLVLVQGAMLDKKAVTMVGGVVAGQTGPDICAMCVQRSGLTTGDPGTQPCLRASMHALLLRPALHDRLLEGCAAQCLPHQDTACLPH